MVWCACCCFMMLVCNSLKVFSFVFYSTYSKAPFTSLEWSVWDLKLKNKGPREKGWRKREKNKKKAEQKSLFCCCCRHTKEEKMLLQVEHWAWILAGICSFLSLVVVSWVVFNHLVHYVSPPVQRPMVRILILVPVRTLLPLLLTWMIVDQWVFLFQSKQVYAVDSYLALVFKDWALYFDLARDWCCPLSLFSAEFHPRPRMLLNVGSNICVPKATRVTCCTPSLLCWWHSWVASPLSYAYSR